MFLPRLAKSVDNPDVLAESTSQQVRFYCAKLLYHLPVPNMNPVTEPITMPAQEFFRHSFPSLINLSKTSLIGVS